MIHAGLMEAQDSGFLGIAMGMFDMTATGITSAIVFSFLFALIFRPKS